MNTRVLCLGLLMPAVFITRSFSADGNMEPPNFFVAGVKTEVHRSVVSDVTSPALLALLAEKAAKYKPSPAMELAIELGFEGITYVHSSYSGAPETLVGQPAPNFTLLTLDGDELELRSFIKNRPAVVTFWGVACGPCCREAPHLTTMHEKYAPDLAIVAVNSYNEDREEVLDFATKSGLKHPIVLNGRGLAQELYRVGAYPTTFWINRGGIVEDYEVGFDSPKVLERRVVAVMDDD